MSAEIPREQASPPGILSLPLEDLDLTAIAALDGTALGLVIQALRIDDGTSHKSHTSYNSHSTFSQWTC